jgi:hypothetical protein
MAKRKRKARVFKVGDCVKAIGQGGSVGRVVKTHRPVRSYDVKFFGDLRSTYYYPGELKHATCTRSTPLAGAKRRRRTKRRK